MPAKRKVPEQRGRAAKRMSPDEKSEFCPLRLVSITESGIQWTKEVKEFTDVKYALYSLLIHISDATSSGATFVQLFKLFSVISSDVPDQCVKREIAYDEWYLIVNFASTLKEASERGFVRFAELM